MPRILGSRNAGTEAWSFRVIVTPLPAEISTDRRGVLNTTLGPKRIEAARDLQRRALAEIALEDFPVIADVLDDAVDPVLGQPQLFAVIAFGAQQALDFGIVGFELLID